MDEELPLKRSCIALVFALSVASPAFAGDPDPCVLGKMETPSGGGFPNTVVSADFDGDNIEDRACARLGELDADGPVLIDIEFGPFDRHGYPSSVTTLEHYKNSKELGDQTLSIIKPGVYESLCTKGYNPCGYGDEAAIYISHPSVSTGTEGASWMYVYTGRDSTDPKRRLFRTFVLSD